MLKRFDFMFTDCKKAVYYDSIRLVEYGAETETKWRAAQTPCFFIFYQMFGHFFLNPRSLFISFSISHMPRPAGGEKKN